MSAATGTDVTGRAELLSLRSVAKTYHTRRAGGTPAVREFSLSLDADAGSVAALVGESGSGKTTVGRMALGLISPTSGEVLYMGTPLGQLSRRQQLTFRREVTAITQDPYSAFNPFYRVGHVFKLVQRRLKVYGSKREARAGVQQTLEFVGLEGRDILARFPHQLSGGERQRLMVARALFMRPKIIVADEPVSMVDANLRVQILEILDKVRREMRVSFLYISHDLSTVYQIADDIFVMNSGAVVEHGRARDVIANPTHPYTKLLLDATPSPDTRVRW